MLKGLTVFLLMICLLTLNVLASPLITSEQYDETVDIEKVHEVNEFLNKLENSFKEGAKIDPKLLAEPYPTWIKESNHKITRFVNATDHSIVEINHETDIFDFISWTLRNIILISDEPHKPIEIPDEYKDEESRRYEEFEALPPDALHGVWVKRTEPSSPGYRFMLWFSGKDRIINNAQTTYFVIINDIVVPVVSWQPISWE